MTSVAIHSAHGIAWHLPFAAKMSAGLHALGIRNHITERRERVADVAILLGTSMWRALEADGGRFLLVDRCSFGETNEYVSLVWDGHGRRGDHKVPLDYDGSRWVMHGVDLQPFRRDRLDGRVILCGQTETYSPHWDTPEEWYAWACLQKCEYDYLATHFRPHPNGDDWSRLPTALDWDDAVYAITLNSSVGVQALIEGIRIRVDDEGGMAYGWDESGRDHLMRWLAWTQWHHQEIAHGTPIAHLFEDL